MKSRVFAVPIRTTWFVTRVWRNGFAHPVVRPREVWGPSARWCPKVDVVTWYRFNRRPAPRAR